MDRVANILHIFLWVTFELLTYRKSLGPCERYLWSLSLLFLLIACTYRYNFVKIYLYAYDPVSFISIQKYTLSIHFADLLFCSSF